MNHQYSRVESQCDYSGEKLSRHNIKAHTDKIHKGQSVKERLKRQATLSNFFMSTSKKTKLTDPNVEADSLEREDEPSPPPMDEICNSDVCSKLATSQDLKKKSVTWC